jgi:hypothetical protein
MQSMPTSPVSDLFYYPKVIIPVIIVNPLNAELNPICHLLALLGAHHILHVSRIRVNPIFISHNTYTALLILSRN